MEIRQLLRLHITHAKMNVFEAESGREAVELLKKQAIDLILLDLMMEEMNGQEVLRHIHDNNIQIPVIVLSAKQQEADKLETFSLGADDYVTKPFSPKELIARIHATLRRLKPILQPPIIQIGKFQYDRESQHLIISGVNVSLSPIEAALFELFIQKIGQVITHEEIFHHVWKINATDRNAVKVYINHLRKKMEEDPQQPKYIETIRGIGYRLVGKPK